MESIAEYLSLFMQYGMPVLPYAGVALVTFQIMSRFVKPMIASHKGANGSYTSAFWLNARRGMVFYPMFLGAVCGFPFGLKVGYSIVAAASAQVWYLILKSRLKAIGVDITADDTNSLAPKEPTE